MHIGNHAAGLQGPAVTSSTGGAHAVRVEGQRCGAAVQRACLRSPCPGISPVRASELLLICCTPCKPTDAVTGQVRTHTTTVGAAADQASARHLCLAGAAGVPRQAPCQAHCTGMGRKADCCRPCPCQAWENLKRAMAGTEEHHATAGGVGATTTTGRPATTHASITHSAQGAQGLDARAEPGYPAGLPRSCTLQLAPAAHAMRSNHA